jgi:iron-sulfur cluster assembly protein
VPVVSIVELGIVRDVELRDGTVVVAVTPLYSGCPATQAINADAVPLRGLPRAVRLFQGVLNTGCREKRVICDKGTARCAYLICRAPLRIVVEIHNVHSRPN